MNKNIKKRIAIMLAFPISASFLIGCNNNSHKHSYVEHEAKNATCLEDGNIFYYTCESCELLFNSDKEEITAQDIVVSKLGHNMTHHAAKEGTDCQTKDGNIEYWSCSNCNLNYASDQGGEPINDVSTYGPHRLVNHSSKEATCETAGASSYNECSACHHYFDNNGEEISENSWVQNPTGHNYSLVVSGTYKTNYQIGESFNTDGMVVNKVCNNVGCEHPEVLVTSYEVVYQSNDVHEFKRGDTKVVIKADNLLADVAVTVSKKTNIITGLNDSYNTHCKTGISLSGVTATSGELSIKYYKDSEHTQEVAESELVVGTYYAVVSTDGLDEDYNVAQAETTIVVTHDYVETSRRDVIGYKQSVCSYCDDKTNSDNLMGEEDISLYFLNPNESGGHDIVATFGMNTSTFPKNDSSDTSADAPRHPMWYSGDYTSAESTINVALPRVNYKLYDEVSFVWDATNDQTNQVYKLGVLANGDLLSTNTSTVHGLIKVTYSSVDGGQLSVQMISNDGLGKTVIVDSDDVIEGLESLTLKFTSTWSRQFHLYKVLLNHVHDATSENIANREDMIGYKVSVCSTCGLSTGVDSNVKMTNDDIVLSNMYGAHIEAVSGTQNTSTYYNGGKIIYLLDSGSYESNIILPRVNYSAYGDVKYSINVASMNGRLGFSTTNNVYGGSGNIGDGKTATIEVVKLVSNEYKATLKFSTGHALSEVITDSDILTGKKGLPLYGTGGGYSTYYITAITVSETCEHSEGYLAVDVIGDSVSMCGKCGLSNPEETRTSLSEDVDYSVSLYGANIEYLGTMGWNLQTNANADTWRSATTTSGGDKITYKPGITGANFKISLPKVRYEKYSSVTFPMHLIGYDCYYGISFEKSVWVDNMFDNEPAFDATITITVLGENQLKIVLEGQGKTIEYTNTNPDVYAGNESVPMFMSTNGTGPITLGKPTLVAKN